MRVRRRIVCGAASVAAVAGGALGVVSDSSAASAQSQAVTQRVIVVFKNQDTKQPAGRHSLAARRATLGAVQQPILAQLRASHARRLKTYTVIDALSATVSPAEEVSLKSDKAVREVISDQFVHLRPLDPTATPGAAQARPHGIHRATRAISGGEHAHAAPGGSGGARSSVCSSNAGQPKITPEGLSLMHAGPASNNQTAQGLGFTGAGVKVGFIADGLDINNKDFIRKSTGKSVFVDYKDFTGEGTTPSHVTGGEEAFGDAGSIAAQGNQTYNVAGYGPHAVTSPCYIKVLGVAPGASLVGLDVFGANDGGFNSTFLDAINYAVTVAHVNVLNESLGNNFYPDDQASADVIKQANDAAVAAGVTVTASSGDAGSTSTIGTPATDPNVISVGATTSYQIDLQDGYAGAQFPGITGYLSNDISSLSSGGYEQDGRTVDVVGPGELNWGLCSTDNTIYEDCTSYAGNPTPVVPFGGTSESAPLTAGEVALVDQAYQSTHGTYPSPAVAKEIVTSTADDINSPAEQQGAGLDDAYKAILAAESYKAGGVTPTPQGANLLKSSSQLNAIDQPGTPERLTDTITNGGSKTQTVSLSSRHLGDYKSVADTTVTLSDTSSPKTTDWAGHRSNYAPVTFTVPSGEDRLDTSIAFNTGQNDESDPGVTARVRITLVDPHGNLAGYSVPQGDGNYGDVQVTDPVAGTWTAYVWSRTAGPDPGATTPNGGTNGPVRFGAQVAKYVSFGSVSPTKLTLAPGQSAPIALTVDTPPKPGDSSGSIVLTGSSTLGFGNTTTIPVTLRSEIPTGTQSFTQTLTGGNGRDVATGQTFYYQLSVKPNTPELNAGVQLQDNPNNPYMEELVDPNGEAEATASNGTAPADGSGSVTYGLGSQAHVLNPSPGIWTVIVTFLPTVSGTALAEPFTVSTSQAKVPASIAMPTTGVTIPAGRTETANVTVKNTGTSPEELFIDARTTGQATYKLVPQLGTTDTSTVPLRFDETYNAPEYLVPTDSTAFNQTATTTGKTPIEFDSNPGQGDPDIESSSGMTAPSGSATTATSSFSANPLAQGIWELVPDVTGAYGATGASPESVTSSMSVTTAPFDTTVTSPTGDLWQAATNPSPNAIGSVTPTYVGPGQTATIPVSVRAQGQSGTKVTGTLYVDDLDDVLLGLFYEPNGNQIAAIPYSYTIR